MKKTCDEKCVLGDEGHCGRTEFEKKSHCEKEFYEKKEPSNLPQANFKPLLSDVLAEIEKDFLEDTKLKDTYAGSVRKVLSKYFT